MNGTYFKGEESFNFNFYTDLSSAMKLKYVNSVVEILIDEYHFNSIIRDLISDFYIVDIFTDIDMTEFKNSPAFLNDVEQLLEETNIADIVKANMKDGLLDELNKAVNLSVSYRTGIHINPLNEALASLVSTLESKVNEVDLTSMMDMVQKFAGMTGELTPESVMNAYMNSDFHQSNLAEIEESKKRKAEFAKDMDKAIKAVSEK